MIEAIIVKFTQLNLILMKIIKIIATRCQILRPKCTNSISAGAPPQTLLEELIVLPRHRSWIYRQAYFKERGGQTREWREATGPLYFFLRIYAHI